MRKLVFYFALLALLLIASSALVSMVRADDDDEDDDADSGSSSSKAKAAAAAAAKKSKAADADDSELDAIESVKATGETHGFNTDVSRMLNIIINSLYTNKEIFLRELISNASDALDKARYLVLTEREKIVDPTLEYEIRIQPDPEHKMLHIVDSGVGMTRDELIQNLGTIAQSGTRNFLDKMKDGVDNNLIGQFGVGFYSAFLVADQVTVASVSAYGKEQWIWQSQADGKFTIASDKRGNTLKRGTRISLQLKDDCEEYLQEDKLRDLIKRYSEFINFPIYLYTSKEVEKEVEVEEPEKPPKIEKTEEEKKDEEGTEDEEEEEEEEQEENKKKTKTITETVYEWELVNENKPIWTRNPKDVDEAEYNKFFKNLTQETEPSSAYIHFKAEGDVEFRSILFVPGKASRDLFENISKQQTNIRLYVRRVFITDSFDDLMPRYLNFVTGVVDSDDLPLNVSREILQQSRLVRIIKKKLVRKVLEMLRKIAESTTEEEGDEDKESDEDKKDKDDKKVPPCPEKYKKIWKEFGKNLRLGVVEDPSNRSRLAKLLRYPTTKTDDGDLVGFDGYISRMKPGQKQIYYVSGETLDALKKSFLLEEFKARDLEVIYMTDPIDEYMVQHLTDYEDYKLTNVAKEGVTFDETEEEKEHIKEVKKQFESFTKWYKDLLGAKVDRVNVSHRRSSQPALLLSGQYGVSANMMRILKAQALARDKDYDLYNGGKVLEINPVHPVIKSLKAKFEADADDEELAKLAELLFETASIQTGFELSDGPKYASVVLDVLRKLVGAEVASTEELLKGFTPKESKEEEEKKDEAATDAAAEDADADDASSDSNNKSEDKADSKEEDGDDAEEDDGVKDEL